MLCAIAEAGTSGIAGGKQRTKRFGIAEDRVIQRTLGAQDVRAQSGYARGKGDADQLVADSFQGIAVQACDPFFDDNVRHARKLVLGQQRQYIGRDSTASTDSKRPFFTQR